MIKFYKIDMDNVRILIKACGESEIYQMECFRKIIEKEVVTVEDICKWCINHGIMHGTKFKLCRYSKRFIMMNIRAYLSYRKIKEKIDRIE